MVCFCWQKYLWCVIVAELRGDMYWRMPFQRLCDVQLLTRFIVMDLEMISAMHRRHIPGQGHESFKACIEMIWLLLVSEFLATDADGMCTCVTACSGWCVGRERNRVWQQWSACPLSYSPWSSAYAGWCCPWVSTVNIAGVMCCFCMMLLLPVKFCCGHWSLLCCVIIFLCCHDKSS